MKFYIKNITIFFIISILFIGIFKFYSYKNQENNTKINRILENKCKNCNVIIIDIDVLRADRLPCYGHNRNTAPNACSLFDDKAVLFKDNYSPSFWTLPSIHSTVTSLYPNYHGVFNGYDDSLPSNTTTIAQTLKDQGYKTAFITGQEGPVLTEKNGGLKGYDIVKDDKDIDYTFTQLSNSNKPWFIHYYSAGVHLPYTLNNEDEIIEKLDKPKNIPLLHNEFNIVLSNYLIKNYKTVFNEAGINKYKSILTDPKNKDTAIIGELFNEISAKGDEKKYLIDSWTHIYNSYLNTFDTNNQTDINYIKMLYDSRLKIADSKLERLINKLKSDEFSKNTIIIFMSSHGESLGEDGRFSHQGSEHSELYLTPLIIKSPTLKQKIINQTTSNIDIFPTVLDMLNLEPISKLQGESLLPYIKGKTTDRFVSASAGFGIVYINNKWLYYLPNHNTSINDSVLYNKISDPNERINVAKNNIDLIKPLFDKSLEQIEYRKENIQIKKTDLSPEKLKRLQIEGYF